MTKFKHAMARSRSLPLLGDLIARLRVEILVPAGGKRQGLSRDQRFERHVDRSAGPEACHPWRGSVWQSNGRPQFSDVSPTTGKPTMRGASTVAWEIHNRRTKPAGKYVLHALHCIRLCVNALHLRLGSQRENLADARAEGTLSRRLTAGQASDIVKLAAEGFQRHELAEHFGVSQVTIKAVLQGRTWSEATGIEYRGPLKPGRPRKPEKQQQPERSAAAIVRGRLPC
jgi:hypothetical protein